MHIDDVAGANLFEARRKIFPRKVDGTYRRLKWAIMAVTLAIYYITPWIRWDRGPYAPDQAVLVDMAARRFFMFDIEIWPHEFYYVAGMLIMAGIGLFLVTSSVGRAWCGYACPHTVWTDLFQHVERFIDGDRNAQYRLAKAPWTASKLVKRVSKHAIWLLIAVATGGAWIFYFADAPTLARQLFDGTAPLIAYATIGILTFTTYFLGGHMREQVCIYMCPWPRIQGAMLDEQSMLVTYKHWRGEPRTKGLKRAGIAQGIEPRAHPEATQPENVYPDEPVNATKALSETTSELAVNPAIPLRAPAKPSLVALATGEASVDRVGDCIDCGACVAVCPTGVDIREGSQIGCITCGLCIDACDEMMEKVGRPPRLIGYTTVADQRRAIAGEPVKPPLKRLFRPRTIAYFSIWGAIGLAMLFTLGTRSRVELTALHDRNPVYVQLSDGAVRNSYTVKLRNMQARPREFRLTMAGVPGAVMWTEDGARTSAGESIVIKAPADQVVERRVFVAAPSDGPAKTPVSFVARALDHEGGEATDTDSFERAGNP